MFNLVIFESVGFERRNVDVPQLGLLAKQEIERSRLETTGTVPVEFAQLIPSQDTKQRLHVGVRCSKACLRSADRVKQYNGLYVCNS